MNNLKHYSHEHERFNGLFIKESGGIVVSPSTDFDVDSLFDHLSRGQSILKFISASPRLIKDGVPGAKFHFSVAPGLSIKFADKELIDLLVSTKSKENSLLSLQLKSKKSFTVKINSSFTKDDLMLFKFQPLIITLACIKTNERNQNEEWHKNPSFRISAPKQWVIDRQRPQIAA